MAEFTIIELMTAVAFYITIAFLMYKYRKKAQVEGKVIFLYKLNYGLNFMKKAGEKLKPLWKIIGTIGVIVIIYFMLNTTWMFYKNMQDIFIKPETAEKAYIIIPGIQTPGSPIYLPFWHGIISLLICMVIHEGAHGIASAAEKIKIKASGVGMFLFIPLAFVEPDTKQMMKSKILSQMRIASAGPLSNIILAFIVLLFIANVVNPAITALVELNGITVEGFVEGAPLQNTGISIGEIILSINDIETMNYSAFSYTLSRIAPGTEITINTDKGNYVLTTAEHPQNSSLSYIGVYPGQNWDYKQEYSQKYGFWLDVFKWFSELLVWLANLSLILGIMNSLPIGIADGGRIMYNLLTLFIKNEKIRNQIMSIITYGVITIIIINVAGSYLIP
ncbi:MAG: M50 family metallopeptidase [Candidatus Nanoarchaeia archaeon]|nr:M50 family metallopeptidase [Candidatus Omnitrophota bacterium]MDD5417481.1 M50 family metallopeptidase [Candidatus Nanoarchaeia archaeon]